MVLTKKLIIITLAGSLLAGCTGVKRMTGQIDDTKLPGQREEILPPDQQQARDPAVTGQPLPQDPNATRAMQGSPNVAQQPQQPAMAAQQPGVAPQQGGLYASAPAQPGIVQKGVAPTAMAAKGAGQETITDNRAKVGDCDPKVDLCPQTLRPEPLPPPSPLVPVKMTKAKTKIGKVIVATDANAAVGTDGTKIVKKKKLPKKKLPAADAVPPEPKLDTPPAPPPPTPQAQ